MKKLPRQLTAAANAWFLLMIPVSGAALLINATCPLGSPWLGINKLWAPSMLISAAALGIVMANTASKR